MTSIVTNNSAIIAIQTLRSITDQLNTVHSQVSTGYRVDVAMDNAAYWSIATTMRSDRRAMAAVQDAIGLGSAKVDTAYAAMDSTVNVLTEFQAKLVAAKEPGVDRAKIQAELEALKEQTVSIAKSASFNGVNWLNTSFTNMYDTAESREQLSTSFVRSSSGDVSVKTTGLDLAQISLFNSTGDGLLQIDSRSPGTVGGIRNTTYASNGYGVAAEEEYTFDGPLSFIDNSTVITFTLTLDADDPATTTGAQPGVTQTYTIDRATIDAFYSSWNGVVPTRGHWGAVLQSVVGGAARILQDGATFSIQTTETSARGSSYRMSGVTSTLPGGKTGGLQNSPATVYGTRAETFSIWDAPFELKPEVEAYIAIDENGGEKTLKLTRDTVMAALGTTTGEVNSASEYVQILNYAFADQGMGIVATDMGWGHIRYDLVETVNPEAGRKTTLGVKGASDNIGNTATFNLLDVDITSNLSLDTYISGVESMLSRVINGAAVLGAMKSRLELQESYNQTVIDSVNTGIGRLVDADMDETSTRLKALEAQQQLSLQALNIANGSQQTILQLFE